MNNDDACKSCGCNTNETFDAPPWEKKPLSKSRIFIILREKSWIRKKSWKIGFEFTVPFMFDGHYSLWTLAVISLDVKKSGLLMDIINVYVPHLLPEISAV